MMVMPLQPQQVPLFEVSPPPPVPVSPMQRTPLTSKSKAFQPPDSLAKSIERAGGYNFMTGAEHCDKAVQAAAQSEALVVAEVLKTALQPYGFGEGAVKAEWTKAYDGSSECRIS